MSVFNFNDPGSILAWLRINPERHLAQLRVFVRVHWQFMEPAEAAAEMLRKESGA